MACKKFIKSIFCIAFILTGLSANAQIAIFQNSLDKLESYKNFSYEAVNIKKENFFDDTVREHYKATFIAKPEDKKNGYLFNIKISDEHQKLVYTDLYNGESFIRLVNKDSTYLTNKVRAYANFQGTLLGCLKWIQSRLEKKSSKITKINDTTINSIDSYHLIANVYDTIINKEHNYTYVNLFIDKLSGMPDRIVINSRNTNYGNGVSYYYSESNYSDYKFNESDMDISSSGVPSGFHPPKERPKEETILLAPGTIAPDWTLYDSDGKNTSLSQLKGKVVMLDFFFIGCAPCMQSLTSLDKLHEKYKDKNFVLLSISDRDSKKSITAFKKTQRIKNQIYPEGNNIAKLYHMTAGPTFYIIDQEGKIANVTLGYDANDFEKKMDEIISGLLKKS